MSAVETSGAGPSRWRVGDEVEVRRAGFPPYRATVEDAAPQFRVVWVRDATAGERHMLVLDECEIRLR